MNIGSTSIVVPNVYNVSNRQGVLTGGESNTTERKFGYYMDLNSNMKDMEWLNLNMTARFDATSRFLNLVGQLINIPIYTMVQLCHSF